MRISKRNRLHQIHRWLIVQFPARRPVRLRIVKTMPADFAGCLGGWDPETRIIYIIATVNRSHSNETLMHEWAHVVREDWSKAIEDGDEGHDAFFSLLYGRIEEEFNRIGWKVSKEY